MTPGPLYRGWDDRPAVLCASGPSFDAEQQAQVIAARARGLCRVGVVNNQYAHVPNADILFSSDAPWWAVHLPKIRVAGFKGELWTQYQADHLADTPPARAWRDEAARLGIHQVPQIDGDWLPDDPSIIAGGSNGGHKLISLFVRFGVRHIILAGYDMKRAGGATHNHRPHEDPLSNGAPSSWVERFTPLARDLKAVGCRVWNCSPSSALDCFERMPLAEALALEVTA